MYTVFLSSYGNTRESLGELAKALETLVRGSCSHSISSSPKFYSCFYNSPRNTVHVFHVLTMSNRQIQSPFYFQNQMEEGFFFQFSRTVALPFTFCGSFHNLKCKKNRHYSEAFVTRRSETIVYKRKFNEITYLRLSTK